MPDETDLDHATDGASAQPGAVSKLSTSRFRELEGHAGEGPGTDEVMALTREDENKDRQGDDRV